jgi:exoribonuclease R
VTRDSAARTRSRARGPDKDDPLVATIPRIHVVPPAGDFTFEQGIAQIQQELQLSPAFPPEVEAAAAHAAANPRLPDLDRTDIALVTIDPPGAMDLDQALFVERIGDGFRVHYAIADVAAFVRAGDPVDVEAHRRGETLYGADSRIPLHPPLLSEGAASLLPGQLRPALLWTIDLDAAGAMLAADVRRARVRSRERLDYASVQARIDAGGAGPMWSVLQAIGERRKQREIARGGVSLALPEQEIGIHDGHWALDYRANHPVEEWNAQLSLLTGMAAARLMLQAKVGILRTLPSPDPRDIDRLRLTARALGIAWPAGESYPDFIRSLDPRRASHVAMMTACTTVLRGAGYVAFDGEVPAQPLHSAIAGPYAHATAPLRRLVDRYTGEACVAICAGAPVPDWVRAALPGLPATMQAADRRAGQYQRAVVDLTEAVILAPRVGEVFAGVIIDVGAAPANGRARGNGDPALGGVVMLRDPAIEARVTGTSALALGSDVAVRLVAADAMHRAVRFEIDEAAPASA